MISHCDSCLDCVFIWKEYIRFEAGANASNNRMCRAKYNRESVVNMTVKSGKHLNPKETEENKIKNEAQEKQQCHRLIW